MALNRLTFCRDNLRYNVRQSDCHHLKAQHLLALRKLPKICLKLKLLDRQLDVFKKAIAQEVHSMVMKEVNYTINRL